MPLIFANPKAEEHYKEALACESREQWQEALNYYNLAAEADPFHPELWYRLGQLSARPEISEGSIWDAYQQAMKCPAITAEAYYWRAKAADAYAWCIHEDFDSEMIADYNAAILLDPANIQYINDRVALNQRQGHFAEALADYNTLLAHEPENAAYYLRRGQLYQRHDQLTAAMTDYNTSLALAYSEEAFKARGVLFLLALDFRNALKSFGLTKGTRYNWWAVDLHIPYPAPGQPTPANRWAAAVRALEASGLIDAAHPTYLRNRCVYFLDRALYSARYDEPDHALVALADADALVALAPSRFEYRELRVACRLASERPDMAGLALDYQWLATHALKRPKQVRKVGTAADARMGARLKQSEYYHKYAWAQFGAANVEEALAGFEAAVGLPLHENYRKDQELVREEETYRGFLPRQVSPNYLLWQIRQQLSIDRSSLSTHYQVEGWMKAAIAELPWEIKKVLAPAFDKFKLTYLIAGSHFVKPRTAAHYAEALALCTAGAQQVPEIADTFAMMHLNILKGQLREALNQTGATPASKEAALAHYDEARAEWAAQYPMPRDGPL